MYGPKTTIVLQKATETPGGGTSSVTWSTVETITSARIRPFNAIEQQLYGRETVIIMKKIRIGYNDIASASRQYLVPESRIQIDSVNYDIESVEDSTGPGRHYKVILRRVR